MPSSQLQEMRQDHVGRLGQHVDQVIAGVPASRRCPGHSSEPAASGGWLRKLFGHS